MISDVINYLAPVQYGNDEHGIFKASKLIGTIATVACAIFFSMGALSITAAAVLGTASILVFLGGFTARPHLVYLGLIITAVWLSTFMHIRIYSAYDTVTTITL